MASGSLELSGNNFLELFGSFNNQEERITTTQQKATADLLYLSILLSREIVFTHVTVIIL